ncbi:MAG: hypothetical protein VX528_20320 [Candidatus Latescibacterota bacterium]|nr:hypothetical protein [Candidatus Latescibacterota bacterium]
MSGRLITAGLLLRISVAGVPIHAIFRATTLFSRDRASLVERPFVGQTHRAVSLRLIWTRLLDLLLARGERRF